MNKYTILDLSYGNLRLFDKNSNIVVMDKAVLEKLINKQNITITKAKNQKYPHLTLETI